MDRIGDPSQYRKVDFYRMLTGHWASLLLALVLAFTGATALHMQGSDRYEASASLLITTAAGSTSVQDAVAGDTLAKGGGSLVMGLADSPIMAEATARRLGDGTTAAEASRRVSVQADPQSRFFSITARAQSEEAARRTADAWVSSVQTVFSDTSRYTSLAVARIGTTVSSGSPVARPFLVEAGAGLLLGLVAWIAYAYRREATAQRRRWQRRRQWVVPDESPPSNGE